MKRAGTQVSAPGEREIVLQREFRASRRLVFDAFTKPDLVRRWLLGPPGHEMIACDVDLRVGGALRYAWRRTATGEELRLAGEFLEVDAPARIVHAEQFDMSAMADPTPMGEPCMVTTSFVAAAGHTMVTMRCAYASRSIRDGMLMSGMAEGIDAGYARLDDVLAAHSAAD